MKILRILRALGNGMELNAMLKEINRLTSRIQGVVTTWQDSTQLKFPVYEKELKKLRARVWWGTPLIPALGR